MINRYVDFFFSVFINPFPDLRGSSDLWADPVWSFTLWIQLGAPDALFAFLARYMPFALAGCVVAFGLSRRKRGFDRQMFVETAYGSWIGFLVGLTYDAIVMIIVQMLEHMTPLGCRVDAFANSPTYAAPILNVIDPSPGGTCLSLAGGAVLFFIIFIVIGMGTYYLIGQRRGTRIRVRFAKGAAYGLLAAGSLMPFIIQYDIWLRPVG